MIHYCRKKGQLEKRWEASDTQLINCECCLGTRDVSGSRQQEQQQRQGLPRQEHTPSENDTYYRRRRRHRTTRAASALKTNRCRIFLERVREGADADGRAQTTTNKGLRMTAPEAEAPMLFCRRPACRYFRNNKKQILPPLHCSLRPLFLSSAVGTSKGGATNICPSFPTRLTRVDISANARFVSPCY